MLVGMDTQSDDVAIEAVGLPATFDICQGIIAAGGHLANIEVHGKPVVLHREKLRDRDATPTTRLVDTVTTPMLIKALQAGSLQPAKLVTHRVAMRDILAAYDTFGNAARHSALKVVLRGS
jgi:alcohol dehydrogenase